MSDWATRRVSYLRGRKECTLITGRNLAEIKLRAIRTKVWFKALFRIERAIVDLTIRCVEKVQSSTLRNALTSILLKIYGALSEVFLVKAQRLGTQLAWELSIIAQKWGNKAAPDWVKDKNFIMYLGASSLYL